MCVCVCVCVCVFVYVCVCMCMCMCMCMYVIESPANEGLQALCQSAGTCSECYVKHLECQWCADEVNSRVDEPVVAIYISPCKDSECHKSNMD